MAPPNLNREKKLFLWAGMLLYLPQSCFQLCKMLVREAEAVWKLFCFQPSQRAGKEHGREMQSSSSDTDQHERITQTLHQKYLSQTQNV